MSTCAAPRRYTRELLLEAVVIASLLFCIGLAFLGIWGGLITRAMSGDSAAPLLALGIGSLVTQAGWLVYLARHWPSRPRGRTPVLTVGVASCWLACLGLAIAVELSLGQVLMTTWMIAWSVTLMTGSFLARARG